MKIKPNTPFLKVRVVFPNTPRKSWQPQLLTARSSFTNEWRAKSKGGDAWEKTTEVKSAPTCGLDTTNNLLELLEKGGLEQSSSRVGTHSAWTPPGVVCHMKAWPRGSPAPVRWHLPLQTTPFCLERCRGVTSVGSELVLTCRWGTGVAKTRQDPSVPSCREVRAGFRLFRVCWLETAPFGGWFCFLSNYTDCSGDSQHASQARFKALAPHCFSLWRVEIHNFHEGCC